MKNDTNKQLHHTIGERVADAINKIEAGERVNLQIDVTNDGVSVIENSKAISELREYAFGATDSKPCEVDQSEKAVGGDRFLSLAEMVRIRHADGFLPNPGKIMAVTTYINEEPRYLVEYHLYGEPKSVWYTAGYLELYVKTDAEIAEEKLKEDAAAAIRKKAYTSAIEGTHGEVVGEALLSSAPTLFDDIARAAAENGLEGSLNVYFRFSDQTPNESEKPVARDPNQP